MYLLGPGMPVMARHVAPEELLEVIKLNELASEAQRSKAAAEAAVEAVEQVGCITTRLHRGWWLRSEAVHNRRVGTFQDICTVSACTPSEQACMSCP